MTDDELRKLAEVTIADDRPWRAPRTRAPELARAVLRLLDDPQWDGTDAAHPAWWRGERRGVEGACMRIEQALGGGPGGTCQQPLHSLRLRIVKLVAERDELARYKAAVNALLAEWATSDDVEVRDAAHDLHADLTHRLGGRP